MQQQKVQRKTSNTADHTWLHKLQGPEYLEWPKLLPHNTGIEHVRLFAGVGLKWFRVVICMLYRATTIVFLVLWIFPVSTENRRQ